MTIGFIGLGVMGEPMCRNLALKSGIEVRAYDRQAEPLARLSEHGVMRCDNIAALAAACDTVFFALPSGAHVQSICVELLPHARPGFTVVDCGTSPVALTRTLAEAFAERGADYADAPIARTRQAAEAGTLSIMVGASPEVFERIRPALACMASDITHCGPVGHGQVAKIMNNMVLVQTVAALCEALTVARAAGMEGGMLLDALSKGSADSFALRNHAARAVVPAAFPERAFSVEYALKDIGYALELAADAGLSIQGAERGAALLRAAIARGDGALYWPVISRVIDAV
jgi:3-hydroxyisobutyrate dehydrogenase-like beta-hydroxyacid dehydrogenase